MGSQVTLVKAAITAYVNSINVTKLAIDKKLIDDYGNKTITGNSNWITTKDELFALNGITLPSVTNGVTRAYNITTNAHGIATITITHSGVSGASLTSTFTISGFKTSIYNNTQIQNIKISDITWIAANVNVLPSTITNFGTTLANQTFNGINGLTLTFKKISDNDANGELKLQVAISKVGHNTFRLFKTLQFKVKPLSAAQTAFNALSTNDITWISVDTSKKTSEITNYGATLTNQTINGITGINITYTLLTKRDTSIVLQATLSKTGLTDHKISKTLTGYTSSITLAQKNAFKAIVESDITDAGKNKTINGITGIRVIIGGRTITLMKTGYQTRYITKAT